MTAWQTSENVLQWLLHFPAGAGDASGRLVIGSPRRDTHEFLEPVDDAVGEMVGKVEHRRGQNGMPAFGAKVAQLLRAHSRPLCGEFVKDLGRNALHQRRRQVQRREKANVPGNPVEVHGGASNNAGVLTGQGWSR